MRMEGGWGWRDRQAAGLLVPPRQPMLSPSAVCRYTTLGLPLGLQL